MGKRRPRWHANPKNAAEVIESFESLGYTVTNTPQTKLTTEERKRRLKEVFKRRPR